LGFPIALAGTLGYVWAGMSLNNVPPGAIGYVYLPAVLVISIASVILAPLGAHTAHRIDIAPLKKVFAFFLLLLAVSFLFH
jgi:uncharacterized membrane protein YfcA